MSKSKSQVYDKLAKRSDELLATLERVAIDDAKVSLAAAKAFKLTRKQLADLEAMEPGVALDTQLAAYKLTFEELQIAIEARKPRSEASYAVQMAHERTGMRIRKTEEMRPQVVVAAVVIPQARVMTAEERAKAPVIDVEER